MKNRFNKLVANFGYAIKGITTLFREEQNAQIHLIVTVAIVSLGFYLGLTTLEWSLVILSIGLVLVAEGINTAIENAMDAISTEQHPKIGKVKDIAAGAVLIAAIIALAIGLLIFIPKLF